MLLIELKAKEEVPNQKHESNLDYKIHQKQNNHEKSDPFIQICSFVP